MPISNNATEDIGFYFLNSNLEEMVADNAVEPAVAEIFVHIFFIRCHMRMLPFGFIRVLLHSALRVRSTGFAVKVIDSCLLLHCSSRGRRFVKHGLLIQFVLVILRVCVGILHLLCLVLDRARWT